MAAWKFCGWILALMATLAISAGNLSPVHGEVEYTYATYNITNNMATAPITVHCYEQVRNIGTVTLSPGQFWFRGWSINPYYLQVFNCNFNWNTPTTAMWQNFEIWTQDDPHSFLYTCTSCQWKVQEDGFYFMQPENSGVWVGPKYTWLVNG